MSITDQKIIIAAEQALASKRGCPAMSRDVGHCNCWHCALYRALKEFKKEHNVQ